MAVVRIPVLFLARLVLGVLRDLIEALGGMLHASARLMLRLVGAGALAVVVYAAFLRMVVDVGLPPVVWLGLVGAALAAMLAWLLAWCLLYLAHPGRLVRRRTDPGREGGVSERRIAEWGAGWRRALLYQERLRHQSAGGEWPPSSGQREPTRWRGGPGGSPCDVLGVDPAATPEQIRAAYRQLALRMHPDRNPGFVPEATRRFTEIQSAYELLSDPTLRAEDPQSR
jgi:hypothetical protein